MGQPNEKEDPKALLDKLNEYEQYLQITNNSSEKSFIFLRNIINEYQNYKLILEKYQRKKVGSSPLRKKTEYKNNKKDEAGYDKNRLNEINHRFERVNKWIKMAKTPYYNNLRFIFQKIKGGSKEKKSNNKELSYIGSTKNIYSKNEKKKNERSPRIRKCTDANNNNNINIKNMNNDLIVITKKLKKNNSFDNSSIISNNDNDNSDNNNNNNRNIRGHDYMDDYTDKIIEERITSFYNNNRTKFPERIFKGPPDSFRWISWCIVNEIPLNRDISIYNNYLTIDLEKDNKDRIIRDIERTFSDKNISNEQLRKKETSLYNILKAFWNLDKEIGYCQGMNLIVGFLLLVSDGNELDTFYMLISNFSSTYKVRKKYNYSFRGLFSEEFPLLYFFNFIFDNLLEENMPEVKKHLDEMGITYDLWIGQWFQTLFTIVLPLNWLKRLWDCIYCDNIFFVVKFGFVFTRLIKKDIMERNEEINIIDFFKEMQKYSLCPENKFLEEKIDINILISKAHKIKIDPEEYLKLYKKKGENFDEFKIKMEKNNKICYLLEYGNKKLVNYKVNHRGTVLFTEEEGNVLKNELIKRKKQMENDLQKVKTNKTEYEDKLENVENKNDKNLNYDPKTKKIKIHINKNITKNDKINFIKIDKNIDNNKNKKIHLKTDYNLENKRNDIIGSDKSLDNINKEKIIENKEESNKINNLELTPEKRNNYFLNNTENNYSPYFGVHPNLNDNNSPYKNYPMKVPKCDINACVNTANRNINIEYNKLNKNFYSGYYPQTECQNKAPNINNFNNINQNNLYQNYYGNIYPNQNNQVNNNNFLNNQFSPNNNVIGNNLNNNLMLNNNANNVFNNNNIMNNNINNNLQNYNNNILNNNINNNNINNTPNNLNYINNNNHNNNYYFKFVNINNNNLNNNINNHNIKAESNPLYINNINNNNQNQPKCKQIKLFDKNT